MSQHTLTGDSSVSALIAEYVSAIASPAERRALRAPLSHVDAELGSLPLRAVRARHVAALLDKLRDAGLSPRRETAILDAVGSLYAFAIARRLVSAAPLPQRPRPPRDASPPDVATPPRRVRRDTPGRAPRDTPRDSPRPGQTPTMTMLALGARVAVWTAWTILIIFAALLVVLVVELG